MLCSRHKRKIRQSQVGPWVKNLMVIGQVLQTQVESLLSNPGKEGGFTYLC